MRGLPLHHLRPEAIGLDRNLSMSLDLNLTRRKRAAGYIRERARAAQLFQAISRSGKQPAGAKKEGTARKKRVGPRSGPTLITHQDQCGTEWFAPVSVRVYAPVARGE